MNKIYRGDFSELPKLAKNSIKIFLSSTTKGLFKFPTNNQVKIKFFLKLFKISELKEIL